MKIRVFLCVLIIFFATFGAGAVPFDKVGPGELDYAGLIIKAGQAWNQAPEKVVKSARIESRVWTQNGILLDRIMIIPAVPNGKPIFLPTSKSQALPLFYAGMLPNEIEELVESSIVKLFGEGDAVVETSMLRPQRFGQNKGFLFNLEAKVSDGLDYKGVAGAMVVDEKLYLMIFLGAEPYYYDRYLDEAVEIIKSARVGDTAYTYEPVYDVAGTYVSDITSNNLWRFTNKKDRRLEIKFAQQGNKITGTNKSRNLKITGVLKGDEITFFTWPSDISIDEIKGTWKISADGTKLMGNWSHPHGGGKWDLTKIE